MLTGGRPLPAWPVAAHELCSVIKIHFACISSSPSRLYVMVLEPKGAGLYS
jgi:hypothetical protein